MSTPKTHPPERWIAAANEDDLVEGDIVTDPSRSKTMRDARQMFGQRFVIQRVTFARIEPDGTPHYEWDSASLEIVRPAKAMATTRKQ